jgi:ribosomal protein S18 acetylase RimI-like enzyme
MPELVLRPWRLEEAQAVLDFWREAAPGETPTDDTRGLGVLWRQDEGSLLLALDGERIVGTVIAAFDGWRGGIYRLAVAPSHRRHGLGRRLVAEAERRLAVRGAKRLAALASSHSEQARGFWDSLADVGWKPTHPGARYAKTLP